MLFTTFVDSNKIIDKNFFENLSLDKQSRLFFYEIVGENFFPFDFLLKNESAPDSKFKGFLIAHNNSFYLFLNTFDTKKIDEFKTYYQQTISHTLKKGKINLNFFKKHQSNNYKIVELSAKINEPITEEITISGSDIQEDELYSQIIEKGNINRVVVYLDLIKPNGALLKIFSDGKFSVIPELDSKNLLIIFLLLLEMIEIE